MRHCRRESRALIVLLDIAGWHEYAEQLRHARCERQPDRVIGAALRRLLARIANDPTIPLDMRARIWLLHDYVGTS